MLVPGGVYDPFSSLHLCIPMLDLTNGAGPGPQELARGDIGGTKEQVAAMVVKVVKKKAGQSRKTA